MTSQLSVDFSSTNQAGGSNGYAKLFRNFHQLHAISSTFADAKDILRCYAVIVAPCHRATLQRIVGVLEILPTSNIFKIIKGIMRFISIFVIHIQTISRTNEYFHDQLVNGEGGLNIILAEFDVKVAIGRVRRHYLASVIADLSKVGHFIFGEVWNRFPLFDHFLIRSNFGVFVNA
jgi:hypothetical protein